MLQQEPTNGDLQRWALRASGTERAKLAAIERATDLDGTAGRRLLCSVCAAPITTEAHRTTIADQHVHGRTNPAGVHFTFGCFSAAPGAGTAGIPTREHTWFAGYAWCFALCGSCSTHLGWRFTGNKGSFFALILDRLRPEPEAPPEQV